MNKKIKSALNLNVTSEKMFIDIVSDFTLQLMFKKPFLFKFRCNIKDGNPQLSEKTIKTLFHFVSMYFA